ncbi:hypothetical protein BLL42_25115 [Pseudomonas frederiksbergensis]|uniref:Uncharacterized protein n=1 Tax=Pseudomonas frederiksbergensis TaxID=104087 RepID=A0A1J0ERV4_9PSED|nr:hypothetical protein [Pseudomonas frederiksbergensis]APC18825.1 hypothetical protein BLL42_25115 [Pseudomonas frederiksbergensis]
MAPLDIEDTSDWLGCPTELEAVSHYNHMLENEVQELTLQLRKAREDIFGLVQMNSQLSSEKANLSRELKKALEDVGRLNTETSERDRTPRRSMLSGTFSTGVLESRRSVTLCFLRPQRAAKLHD